MISRSTEIVFDNGLVVFLLFSLLFADGVLAVSPGYPGSLLREIVTFLGDPRIQWMFVFCLACDLIALLVLEQLAAVRLSPNSEVDAKWSFSMLAAFFRANGFNRNLWLVAIAFFALSRYAWAYEASVHSIQVPVLLSGCVCGKVMSTWARWRNDEIERRVVWLILILTLLLAASALWQPGNEINFQYHGIHRWSGTCDNPNLYGLLMGVGLVPAIGLVAGKCGWVREERREVRGRRSEINIWRRVSGVWRIGPISLFVLAATVLAFGLFYSFSRGAWVGTAGGIGYLAFQTARQKQKLGNRKAETGRCKAESSKRKTEIEGDFFGGALPRRRFAGSAWLLAGVILASVGVLCFWQFRQADWHPARRAFSVVNPVDFSWRNRMAAWEGALQITAEHPWLGAGWNQPELLYEHFYLPPKLTESAAIQMNDYLMLGATLGVPVLGFFGMYVWRTLTNKAECRKQKTENERAKAEIGKSGNRETGRVELDWLRTTCHAGAIVLLVGFWLDGGLFKLPTAATFWILLELGAVPRQNYFTAMNAENTEIKTGNC
jgi:hypothetical protein